MSNQAKKNEKKAQNEITLEDLEQVGGGTATLGAESGKSRKIVVVKPGGSTGPFNPPIEF